MNRLHHLKHTLGVNMRDNAEYREVEFVLLDYNSEDGLQEFIQSTFMDYIKSGSLVYYKTPHPLYFNRSHSRNMAFRLASGDILCNLDADNFTGENFAGHIASILVPDRPVALNVLTAPAAGPDVTGRVCVRKRDFLNVQGYDERFEGYGYEDNDLINRLELSGVHFQSIVDARFLKYLPHSNTERIQNERLLQMVQEVWIQYMDPATSNIVLLLQDGSFQSATIIHNYTRFCSDIETLFQGKAFSGYKLSFKEDDWQRGCWHVSDKRIKLQYKDGNANMVIKENGSGRLQQEGSNTTFYRLTQENQVKELIFFASQVENRNKMTENQKRGRIRVNEDGFGRGLVFKNFESVPLTI